MFAPPPLVRLIIHAKLPYEIHGSLPRPAHHETPGSLAHKASSASWHLAPGPSRSRSPVSMDLPKGWRHIHATTACDDGLATFPSRTDTGYVPLPLDSDIGELREELLQEFRTLRPPKGVVQKAVYREIKRTLEIIRPKRIDQDKESTWRLGSRDCGERLI